MLIIFVISKSPIEELTLETVVVVSVVDAFDVEFVVLLDVDELVLELLVFELLVFVFEVFDAVLLAEFVFSEDVAEFPSDESRDRHRCRPCP